MYRSLLSQGLFSELDRLQRLAAQSFDISPGIRGLGTHRFPAVNVSTSPHAVEIDCFAPGIDPKNIEVKLEQGVLSISGERSEESVDTRRESNVHIEERFAGKFRRVITLPDDVDGNATTASCKDGVLKIRAPRREAAQPRRITIQ